MGIPGVMPSKKTAEIFNVQFTTPMVSPDLYNITLPRRRGVIIIIWNLKGVQKTMGKTHAKTASLGVSWWVVFFHPNILAFTPRRTHILGGDERTLNLGPCHVGFVCFRESTRLSNRCNVSFLATCEAEMTYWMLRNRRMQKDATGNSERSSCGLTPHFPG